jgi:hypothetical protein
MTMAITLENNARNAACDAIAALHDGGTLEFQTSGGVEVATVTFGTPAFGASSAGTATANNIAADTSATGGTTAQFVTKTSGGAQILGGSVDTSLADIVIDSTVIPAGVSVSLNAFTITVPAA